ncbi:MAG TPA: DUF2243 domain-containing protein, partial [Polyangiaceae bacterium]|nr:DUF2243 domain-containing protein [Polyangiaceae bacterium]
APCVLGRNVSESALDARHRSGTSGTTIMDKATHHGAIISSGLMLGTGLGGFFDGILLHQLLQWHNMLSSVRPPIDLVSMKYNMLWDGLFHSFTWLMTVAGLARLWRAGLRSDVPWSTSTFAGSLSIGWGLFNFIEGIVDHQLLGVHHVHPGSAQLAWDLGFLASGLVMIAAGLAAVRSGHSDATPRGGMAADRYPAR